MVCSISVTFSVGNVVVAYFGSYSDFR